MIKHSGKDEDDSRACVQETMDKLSRALAISPPGHKLLSYILARQNREFNKMVPALSAPRQVFWEVTHACNLRCLHCVTSSGSKDNDELDSQEAFALIDRLADMKVFYLIITGGEPFLRPDILELLRHISTKNMMVKVDTNGTLIDDDAVDELLSLRLSSIQVSIDGIGGSHDRFRGKKGTYKAACGTIERLIKKGIPTNITTTVTRQNLSGLNAVIDLAVRLHCNGITINPFVPVGRGLDNQGLKLDGEDYYRLYQTIHTRARELAGIITISTDIGFTFLFEPSLPEMRPAKYMGCGVGYDTLSIGAGGTVYPCPFLHEYPLGNIRDVSLEEIWDDASFLKSLRPLHKRDMGGECKNCKHALRKCTGGCRARAYHEYGDLKAPDPACIFSKIKSGDQR
ncbi:conserved hypothetical protein [Methanocella paludicola SANAE]|uniref:Radical SAM core domain-containing protein n=1 Tax=Methanocella paludicola (strain DSM 17711 / JCM 13418 / NBRC 101707 / SANAE) TaxID=304371 RepID=D1Z188_METPS|nr:radical SAM protein [Methanocella paludicola]BAI62460.1 conserved hypothetical protein [Methanocella paludicola SANAE]